MLFGQSQAPRVWSKRDPMVPRDAVYVGRGTPWGNPFVMSKESERDEVCDKFEALVLPTLDVRPLIGKHLICWCAPKRCHADALLRAALAAGTQSAETVQPAQSEGCQSGPTGNAQPLGGDHD